VWRLNIGRSRRSSLSDEQNRKRLTVGAGGANSVYHLSLSSITAQQQQHTPESGNFPQAAPSSSPIVLARMGGSTAAWTSTLASGALEA